MSISSKEGEELKLAIVELKDEITNLKDNHLHHLSLDVATLKAQVNAVKDDMANFKGWLLSGFSLTLAAILGTVL